MSDVGKPERVTQERVLRLAGEELEAPWEKWTGFLHPAQRLVGSVL
jgi:hypothetical protein